MAKYTETLSGDGSSSVYRATEVVASQRQRDTHLWDDVESVGFSLIGTWSGVTATLEVCMDENASPQLFAAVPAAAFTQDVADFWRIPLDAVFRVTVSGSGSPLPSLTMTVRGDIRQLA